MALMDQYSNVFQLANQIGLKNPEVTEQNGKLRIKGLTAFQADANQLWDAIKTHPNWANEIVDGVGGRLTLHQPIASRHTCLHEKKTQQLIAIVCR